MVVLACGYIEKTPRSTLCVLKDPLTMDELVINRLGLEYSRFDSPGLGIISYTSVLLSDGQVISITKRDHQNGRINYRDSDNTHGGIIELEYDYGTFKQKDPALFPTYQELLSYVLSELKISEDEVLNNFSFIEESYTDLCTGLQKHNSDRS